MIRRLGLVYSQYLGEWSDLLVDEQYRKCVVYLCADIPNSQTGAIERRPCGTAFIVGYQRGEWSVLYLVTAQHVISYSRSYGPLFVRVNMKDGSVEEFIASQDIWEVHPTTDVAVCRIPAGRFADADTAVLPAAWMLDDDFIKRHQMGTGDPVFFTGLFSPLPGRGRIQPIIRFGSISLMPHEKVPIKLDPTTISQVNAFLVEAHSRGGLSGSPAFVLCNPLERESPVDPTVDYPLRVMGVVSGHYNVHGEEDSLTMGEQLGDATLNAGIVVVIPAQTVTELLESEEMKKERDELLDHAEEEREDRDTPEPDSEFGRFEKLASGLLAVPKKEVNELEERREKRPPR